jgi:hypothetical protein
MDRTPTPGQSDPRSKVPMGVVTRSRADTQLPHMFRDLVEECPRNWEVRRIAQLTPARQDRQWRFIRASRSVFDRIPASLDMDVLFYRFPSERSYCQRLSQLKPHQGKRGKVDLSVELICLSTPWVSGQWRDTLPLDPRQRHPFPRTGDLSDPEGSNVALDSAQALRDGSILWGTGDPGRLLEEIRQEYRNADRYRLLVPWQQTEVHGMPSSKRNALYVQAPRWWYNQWWTSAHMFVPLPPILTYRASRLIEGGSEGEYWHTVFEAEWVVLVLSRWCADIIQRRIMWRLPGQARAGINTMGLGKLLRGSPYGVDQLRRWLYDHDLHLWGAKHMSLMLRGPSRGEEAQFENVEEFVRFYTPSTEPLPKGAHLTLPGYRSPATNPPRPHLPAYDVDNEVEFELDPHPTGSPPSTVTPATDPQPRASPPSTEAAPMANKPMSPEVTPRSPQSPVFQSPEHFSPLLTSSSPRDVGDHHTPEGPDSPRMGHSPRVPSKFDRVDREPELPKEVSPQVSRSNPRGNHRLLPRDFPGLHIDPILPSTLQENLRLTKTDRLIQVSTRGFYRANTHGEQPLTERTLVETLIVMHEHITAVENDARRERATRVLAEERLRNSELLVRFLQSEAAARETHGVKRPRDERDP